MQSDDFDILLSLPPEKLSYICSVRPKMAEICATDEFVKAYAAKHKKEITRRRLKISADVFVPTKAERVIRHPKLPKEEAIETYVVVKPWHWAFETWASHIHYQGHNPGEIPHFNIRPATRKRDDLTLHVYLDPRTLMFLVMDTEGQVLYSYAPSKHLVGSK